MLFKLGLSNREHQLIQVCAADLLQTIVMTFYLWCGCISKKMVHFLLCIPSSTHLSTLPANHIGSAAYLLYPLPIGKGFKHARSKYNFFNGECCFIPPLSQVLQAARSPQILMPKLHGRQYHSLFLLTHGNTFFARYN